MSMSRRLGRFARGFVSGVSGGSQVGPPRSPSGLEGYLRTSKRRGENLRDALEVAWRSASEEWRRAEEQRTREERENAERYRDTPSDGSYSQDYRRQSDGPGFGERVRDRARERIRDDSRPPFTIRKYSPEVLRAYERLGLLPGVDIAEVDRKRREMVKKFHPDRFTDHDKRVRAERVTAEINAAHDVIARNGGR